MIRFQTLDFARTKETDDNIHNVTFGFFIPGVNSGVYDPTLHINVHIIDRIARLFGFKKRTSFANITLTRSEFDQLYFEMTKIKRLRDALDAPAPIEPLENYI